MTRLEELKSKVSKLYEAKNPERADWADWLYEHHIFVVANHAANLADRFHADGELAAAAGMLHDIADVVMKRENPVHEKESFDIARRLLEEAGFSNQEIRIVVDDAIRFHSCREGTVPHTLEGKVVATADALAHLDRNFYDHAVEAFCQKEKSVTEIKEWVRAKLERDFNRKILFNEIKEEVRQDYDELKEFFSKRLNCQSCK